VVNPDNDEDVQIYKNYLLNIASAYILCNDSEEELDRRLRCVVYNMIKVG